LEALQRELQEVRGRQDKSWKKELEQMLLHLEEPEQATGSTIHFGSTWPLESKRYDPSIGGELSMAPLEM
ncbi:hypothetical protein U1Q18_041938, partial [Sarracenia purpurea var. burkii]